MKTSKRILSFFMSVLMLLSMFSSISAVTASAASAPKLTAESKTVDNATEFTVAVKLTNAAGVYNGNFTLQYDSSKIEAVSYAYGSIFNEHTRNCNLNYQSTGDQIRFTFSGAYALTGDGTLVTFTFNAKENVSGDAELNFTAYKMYDENGISLSPTAENATVSISAKSAAQPCLSVSGGTVNSGETISVPVKISNAADVYNGNFTLKYDSSLLTVESYTYGSIFNEHTRNCNLDYQSTGDQIRFTFSGAYALTGDGTLVTFTFNAKENVSGDAELNFTAYKMYDENGISLSPTAENGNVIIESTTNIVSGRYGGSIDYELNLSTGVLSLSPYSDYMLDSNGTNTPWEPYKDSITSICIHEGISNIGSGVFQNCNNLMSVSLPNGLKSIGDFAFYGCSSLINIIIPDTVEEIGQGASNYCLYLSNIELPNTYISIGEYAFYNTAYAYDDSNSEDGLVYIGSHLVSTSPNTYDYYFGDVTIKDGTTDIAIGTFANSSKLTSISLPSSMIKIEYETFKNCINLQRVEFTKSINCIDYYAFENCISLEAINIPESVKEIRDYAFKGCTSLQSIYFFNTQIDLGNNLFDECNKSSLIIYGYKNSTSEDYANQYNIPFIALDAVELSSISIYSNPTKQTYYIGDTLDTSGLQLELTYSDGSTETVSSGYTTSGFNSSSAGTKTVTVTYEGLTAKFNVTVSTPSISISSSSKTMTVGDTATLTATTTPSGQTVTWTSSNTSIASVSGGTVTAKAAGTATITAKFTYNGITYSKTCSVTVADEPDPDPTPASLTVSSKPTKTVYEIGESLDTSGLKLKLTYSDGSTEIITSGFTTSGFSSATAGTKTVTVKYSDLTAAFTVTVNAASVDGPRVTVESKKASVGSTVYITVSLEENPGIWGMDLVVNYDKSQLTLNNVTNGTVFSESEWTPGNLSGDRYILSYEASGFDDITTNGVLATLEFTVSENATVDSFSGISLSYNTGDIINVNFDDINVAVVSGGINITDFIYGDLNGDGLVNKKDSLLMKMYLADNSTVIDKQAADVYVDGSINKKDSLYLKQYLAGLDVELGA